MRTRAINIRYFFIADQVEKGNVEIKYCPTNMMIGDFFTNSLQGKKFKFFRDLILGKKSVSAMEIDARSVLKDDGNNGEFICVKDRPSDEHEQPSSTNCSVFLDNRHIKRVMYELPTMVFYML
jgi:hypothetical protein